MKRGINISIILIALVFILFIVKVFIANSYNEKGKLYFTEKKYDLAIEYYKKAIKWKKSKTDYKINLASAYIENNQIELARKMVTDLLKKKPEESKLLVISGRILIIEKKYDEAIEVLTASIHFNPKLATAYFHRGRTYTLTGENESALKDFNKAIELKPEYADAYWKRISVKKKLNDIEGTITDYTVLIRLDPKNYKTYEGRGIIYHDLENYDKALPDLLEAIKRNDTSGASWYYSGRCYALQSDLSPAIKHFRKSAELRYRLYNSFYNLGFAYFNDKNADSARYFFNQIINSEDTSDVVAKSYYYLGNIDLYSGKPAKAIPFYSKAVQLNPDYDAAFYNRGHAYFGTKQYIKAENDYLKCIRLGMNTGDLYYNLGAVKVNQYKYKDSCPYLKKSVALGNKNAKQLLDTYCK